MQGYATREVGNRTGKKSNHDIGSLQRDVDAPAEYLRLAQEDEEVALILRDSRRHRQAVYFLLQAMEKRVKAKIFTIKSPWNKQFREENRSHTVDEMIYSFIDLLKEMKYQHLDQVRSMLVTYVISGVDFRHLHNNVRYPFFVESKSCFFLLDIGSRDVDNIKKRLDFLKSTLDDIHMLGAG